MWRRKMIQSAHIIIVKVECVECVLLLKFCCILRLEICAVEGPLLFPPWLLESEQGNSIFIVSIRFEILENIFIIFCRQFQ